MEVEARLEELGLVLPEPLKAPPGLHLPFSWVRVRGNRAYVSGHGAQNPDGSLAGPFGKVGAEVSLEQGYEAARLTALSVLGNLKRTLGDLNRLSAWLRVFEASRSRSKLRSNYSATSGNQRESVILLIHRVADKASLLGNPELPVFRVLESSPVPRKG